MTTSCIEIKTNSYNNIALEHSLLMGIHQRNYLSCVLCNLDPFSVCCQVMRTPIPQAHLDIQLIGSSIDQKHILQ